MYSAGSLFFVVFFVLVPNGSEACFTTNEHQRINKFTGSSFYEECQCTEPGFTTKDLRWLNNHDQFIEPLRPGTSSNVYMEKLSDSINLHISGITKAMSGTYKCVTQVDGKTFTHSYTITANDPIYFYDSPSKQSLIKDQLSLIKCQPKSDTTVDIIWQKEKEQDELIDISNDDKYLIVEEIGLYITNATENDAGNYKCTARAIATNEEVDKYIKVDVITKPQVIDMRIDPFPTVVVGETLSIECIADGTPHPHYVWNKTMEGTPVSNVTWRQEVNTIIFDSIKAEDGGLYTCYAINSAGDDARNVSVEVLIPPTITDFPNITEVEGQIIPLICNASGNSEPNITLIYKGRDFTSNIDQKNYEFIPNMAFIHLSRSTEGIYVCNASNEVESIEQAMYLTVLHRPYFDILSENIFGWYGKTVNMSCIQDSNPPAAISWRFQGNDIGVEEEIKINKWLFTMTKNNSENYFSFTIDNETDYGTYECTAKNAHGDATKLITLREGFKPEMINNASIIDLTATSITFYLEGPTQPEEETFYPLLPVLGFTATYDEAKNYNITDIHINRTWSLGWPFKLEKLKPNTTYYVKFAAVNEVGAGEWTEYLMFTTMEKSVPNPPEWDDNPITLESNRHVLKWKAPDDNGEPIDNYILRYCPETDEKLCKVRRVSPTTELEFTDLEFNTTYSMELIAHNAVGYSMASNISVTVPAPKINLPSTMLSSGAIIAISIVIVVLCLLLLDVLLLVWRRQGIIATCCFKKDRKRKESVLNSRDKKGLLNGETGEEPRPASIRSNNGHKEYQYNKNTGVVTGKHSAV